MKISLELLYREIKDLTIKKIQYKNFSNMAYIGICPICDLTKPLEGYILFGYAKQFVSNTYDQAIISIGEPAEDITEYNDVIVIDPQSEPDLVYKQLLDVFERYENWRNTLHESVVHEKNLQYIAEISQPIFNNPILIHDLNFNILAYIEANYQREIVSRDYDNQRILSLEVINDFKIDPEYQQTMKTYGPNMFSANMFGYQVLYQNLWIEHQYVGRVVVSEINSPLTKSDEALLQYLADFITNAFRLGYYHLSEKSRHLSNMFRRMLSNQTFDKPYLDATLENAGWSTNDSFLCACLITDDRDAHTNTIRSVRQSLELQFPQACIFQFHNNIIIVINTTLEHKQLNDISSDLGVFLREGLFQVGFSSLGNNFLMIKYYYLQAIAAHETGNRINPSFWQYRFDDYVLPYIFEESSKVLPKNMIVSQDLAILNRYDKEHQTELYQTLFVYLENNLSITKTSVDLDIHRSTLLYRLDRIKQLIHSDLEHAKARFYLMWSYYLLKE